MLVVRWCSGSTPGSQPDGRSSILLRTARVLPTEYAPFGYGLVFCPFKAEERVRGPHGVPVSGSSVVESAVLIQRRPEVQFLPGQRQNSVIGRVAQSMGN